VLFLFFVTGKEAFSLTVKQSYPDWLDELLKGQEVSKEVLLHFKEHYLTSNQKESEK
jgi:hypothetical protein